MNRNIENELMQIKGAKLLLQVDDVWTWAKRNKKSALHSQFEWDLGKAAVEHWRSTARSLIALHITFASGERRMVSLSIDRVKEGGGYRNVEDVVAVPDLLDVMIDDALRELERFKAKYESVVALRPVIAAADQVRAQRTKTRKAKPTENRPAA